MLVQVVNFIDVLYTLHSHFNHESTDFTGYHGKRVNFMPAYLHVHSNRDIERIPSKRKKKKRIFFSLDGFLDRTNSRSSFELVNYSRFVFFFFFIRRLKNWKKMVLRMFLLSFCFVEGGRYTESGEANDEGEEIYKICIGRV